MSTRLANSLEFSVESIPPIVSVVLTDSKKAGGNLSLIALFRSGPKLNLFALGNVCYHDVGVLSLHVGVVILLLGNRRKGETFKGKTRYEFWI